MIPTIDRADLDTAGQLTLRTGFTPAWAPGTDHYITAIEGWFEGAPIRRRSTERLSAHGTIPERGYRDERLVSISAHYTAASRGEALGFIDQVNGLMGDGTEGRLVVDDASLGARWAEVFLAPGAVDMKYRGGIDVPYTVHMVAPDARKYGLTPSSDVTGVSSPGSGLVFPLFSGPAPGVLNLGAGGASGRVTLTNTGKADTGPVYTFTADAATEFTITEVATQRRLRYVGQVVAGQTVVLDANDGSVTLDGYARQEAKLLESQWTRLGPGEVGTWALEAPGSTNAKLTVEVFPAWW